MTVFKYECRRGMKSTLIWAGSVCALVIMCMAMYPEMRTQMESISNMFASLGAFTAAFGMDKLPLGTAMGFYGVEIGTTLSLAGAMFAAVTGIGIIAKEEGGHTAEWLLTHPISRARVLSGKLAALGAQLLLFNAICVAVAFVSFLLIGEPAPGADFFRFHISQLVMHCEIACICFGISAFLSRANAGIGLGLAFCLYFMSILLNLSDRAAFLRYVTPFQYCDAAAIFTEGKFFLGEMLAGIAYAAAGAAAAYLHYGRKDIAP